MPSWRGRPAGSPGEAASGNYWSLCSTLSLLGLKHQSHSGLASGVSGSSGRFGGPLSAQNRAKVDISKAFSPAFSHPRGFCSVQLRSHHLARRADVGNRPLMSGSQLQRGCGLSAPSWTPGAHNWGAPGTWPSHFSQGLPLMVEEKKRKPGDQEQFRRKPFLTTFLRHFILPPDISSVPYCPVRWLISNPGVAATTLAPFLGPTEPRPQRYHSMCLIPPNLRKYRASHFLHESSCSDPNPDPCAPCVTSTSVLVWVVPGPVPASEETIYRERAELSAAPAT